MESLKKKTNLLDVQHKKILPDPSYVHKFHIGRI